jgi:hypothetical protein
MVPNAKELGARLRFALDLVEAAEELFRRRVRRENPAISEEEIDSLFAGWVHDRPDAPYGDAPGRRRDTLAVCE